MKNPIYVNPKHEPEVLAAGAKKKHRIRNVVPPSDDTLIVNGVRIISRYDDTIEREEMSAVIRSVDAKITSIIKSVFCDSKSKSYNFVLRVGYRNEAIVIAEILSEALCAEAGGHNDLTMEDAFGDFYLF